LDKIELQQVRFASSNAKAWKDNCPCFPHTWKLLLKHWESGTHFSLLFPCWRNWSSFQAMCISSLKYGRSSGLYFWLV